MCSHASHCLVCRTSSFVVYNIISYVLMTLSSKSPRPKHPVSHHTIKCPILLHLSLKSPTHLHPSHYNTSTNIIIYSSLSPQDPQSHPLCPPISLIQNPHIVHFEYCYSSRHISVPCACLISSLMTTIPVTFLITSLRLYALLLPECDSHYPCSLTRVHLNSQPYNTSPFKLTSLTAPHQISHADEIVLFLSL